MGRRTSTLTLAPKSYAFSTIIHVQAVKAVCLLVTTGKALFLVVYAVCACTPTRAHTESETEANKKRERSIKVVLPGPVLNALQNNGGVNR